MVCDLLLHIINELIAGGNVVLVNAVLLGLLVVQGTCQVLEEEVDLVNGGTSCSGQLDHGQQGVTQGVTVDLGENRFGILELVLLLTSNDGEDQSKNYDELRHFYS